MIGENGGGDRPTRITDLKEFEIGLKLVDRKYGVQEVYLTRPNVTVFDAQKDGGDALKITLHTHYRPTVWQINFGADMIVNLGEYDENKDAKKWIDFACRLVSRENEEFMTRIDESGHHPTVVNEPKEVI